MVTDVTYELMKIGNNLTDDTKANVNTAVDDINNIVREMIESDSQFQFKKGIFRRQYNADVEYSSFNTIRIHVKDDNRIYYISVEISLKCSLLGFGMRSKDAAMGSICGSINNNF